MTTQVRNTATGEWKENTATATTANASTGSGRRDMAAVKGTRNEIHTAKLRNKATVLGMCLFLLKKPQGSDQIRHKNMGKDYLQTGGK